MKQWEKYVQKTKGEKESIPSYDKVLKSTELVLDNHGQLQEINRVAGENEVSTSGIYKIVHVATLVLMGCVVMNLLLNLHLLFISVQIANQW